MDLADVKTLTRTLMDEHELVNWKIVFIKSKSVAGRCWTISYSDNSPRMSFGKIELSEDFMKVFGFDEVKETILHEIAHARTNPKFRAHGPEWKAMARSIGSTGERCVSREAPHPESKWTGVCRGKGCKFQKNRLTNSRRYTSYCGKCSKRGEPVVRIDWYDTKELKKGQITSSDPQVSRTPTVIEPVRRSPVAAQKAPKEDKPLSWKEKFDRGMTEIDW